MEKSLSDAKTIKRSLFFGVKFEYASVPPKVDGLLQFGPGKRIAVDGVQVRFFARKESLPTVQKLIFIVELYMDG